MQSSNTLASGPLEKEAFCELIFSRKLGSDGGMGEVLQIKMLKFSFVLSVSDRKFPRCTTCSLPSQTRGKAYFQLYLMTQGHYTTLMMEMSFNTVVSLGLEAMLGYFCLHQKSQVFLFLYFIIAQ